MRISVFAILISFFLFSESCNIVNPAEQTPTYVHIDSFQFVPKTGTGTQSHRIIAVSAYLDYAPLGMFDLPADIPVLTEKSGSLMLRPVVSYSGLGEVLINYPYYQADTTTFIPAPGKKITITPKTHYLPDSLLLFTTEDFESGNSFVVLEGDTLMRTSDPQYVFEGTYGGLIKLTDTAYAVNIMSVGFQGPSTTSDRTEAYLELNYKCSVPFLIGLQTSDGGSEPIQYLNGFNPRSNWNKVYIGLKDFLAQYPSKTYRVVVRTAKNTSGTDYVAFDNFKVVTRK